MEKEPRYELPDVDAVPPEPGRTPPPQSCEMVGAVVAAAELGNYAEPEAIAPVKARYQELCKRLQLGEPERTCVTQQRDKPAIAYCAPTLIPEISIEVLAPEGCADVLEELEGRVAKRPLYDHERRWWTIGGSEVAKSCQRDRWTLAYAQCAKSSSIAGCIYQTPAPLRTKLHVMNNAINTKWNEHHAQWHKAYAEPKKYPGVKVAVLAPAKCGELMRAIEKRSSAQVNSWEAMWWTTHKAVMAASCKKDRWTVEVAACMRDMFPGNCTHYAPNALSTKLYHLINNQPRTTPPPPRPPRRR